MDAPVSNLSHLPASLAIARDALLARLGLPGGGGENGS